MKKIKRQLHKHTKIGSFREEPAEYQASAMAIYKAEDGKIQLELRLEQETVWLSQKQMAELFETERSVISKHLRNIFTSGELQEKSNVQKMHIAFSDKPTAFYSLDVAISVGYRVNSKRGTQFRIWATSVLREHLLKGYTVNDQRLKELNKAVRLIADVVKRRDLTGDEAKALLAVVSDYMFALDLLDDYDHQQVALPPAKRGKVQAIDHAEVLRIIKQLRGKFGGSELFGREKDHGLFSALGAVWQTIDGKDVYPSLEEKAAHLLYFLVKNHAFVDGNKRIAAAVLLWFLEKNAALYNPDGSKRLADNALVAMTLLIAESRPQEKDLLCRVLVNLIRGSAA
jgi:prophage maintenance system killer protein